MLQEVWQVGFDGMFGMMLTWLSIRQAQKCRDCSIEAREILAAKMADQVAQGAFSNSENLVHHDA
jgi:hypothetical protein